VTPAGAAVRCARAQRDLIVGKVETADCSRGRQRVADGERICDVAGQHELDGARLRTDRELHLHEAVSRLADLGLRVQWL
jgi:hypothetical protein